MLNKIEKAYKKSDVYLEVLSYLVILIVVGIYFNLAAKITLSIRFHSIKTEKE